MIEIKVVKVYETLESLNESEEFKKIWAGLYLQPVMNWKENIFLKGFLTDTGKLYQIRKCIGGKDDGLQLLNEVSTVGCLHNAPFKTGYYNTEDSTININDEKSYNREQTTRTKLGEIHKFIMDDKPIVYCFVTIDF